MTPLTLASHLCTVVLLDTDEVVMGRGPDKSLGVVLVFEATELVWVYFVTLLCMGSPSFFKILFTITLTVTTIGNDINKAF